MNSTEFTDVICKMSPEQLEAVSLAMVVAMEYGSAMANVDDRQAAMLCKELYTLHPALQVPQELQSVIDEYEGDEG